MQMGKKKCLLFIPPSRVNIKQTNKQTTNKTTSLINAAHLQNCTLQSAAKLQKMNMHTSQVVEGY